MPVRDIERRTFTFACRIVELCFDLQQRSPVIRRLSFQLLDSGTSIGANTEEGDGGESKRDFIHKRSICLKEAKETHFWLRVILRSDPSLKQDLQWFLQEAHELIAIFTTIVRNAKLSRSRGDGIDRLSDDDV